MRIIKKYTLLTLVGIFALTGCGKAAQNTQEDVNSASDATHLDADFKKNFDTIELNGSTYKLPMEYSDYGRNWAFQIQWILLPS